MSLHDASEEDSTPATPSTGRQIIYPKATGWFTKNSAGVEEQISGASKNTRPCFRAVNSGTQAISATTDTKVNLATETFDTNTNFASSRFTPTIVGKYLITGSITFSGGSAIHTYGILNKNGSNHRINYAMGVTDTFITVEVSDIVDMNGTTDYIELHVWAAAGITVQEAFLAGSRVD